MSKLIILNQEINADEWSVQDEAALAPLKAQFLKNCLLELMQGYVKEDNLPLGLVGFIQHLISQIKNADIYQKTDGELVLWLDSQVTLIQEREQNHTHWHMHAPLNKRLSFFVLQLKSRLFFSANQLVQSDEFKELNAIILNAKRTLQDKIIEEGRLKERDHILQIVQNHFQAYRKACYWPISLERREQQRALLSYINNAPDTTSILKILNDNLINIEQQHILKSQSANITLFRRASRLTTHLKQAIVEIGRFKKLPYPTQSRVENEVENAVEAYLQDDLFYHNRRRRYNAHRLLIQLRNDGVLNAADQLQRKYKMRTTLDQFINEIDKEFNSTHFFSKLFANRRSRLAHNLEVAKQRLINQNLLPALELEQDIKQPIVLEIKNILTSLNHESLDVTREVTTVCAAILEAKTPEAIEAIIEGHIRSYFKQAYETNCLELLKNMLTRQACPYYTIALKLEHALLNWQAIGLLPATSGYKTFLQTLGEQRQTHENELRCVEQKYGIKIPRDLKSMREYVVDNRRKATSLLDRIKNLKLN